MQYTDINVLRKQGNLQQALALAESAYAQLQGRQEAISLFWCLNDDLRQSEGEEAVAIAQRMRNLWENHDPENAVLKKTVESAEKMVTPEGQIERKGWKLYRAVKEAASLNEKKDLLFQYLKLNNPRPSLLHSLILQEAIKIDKNAREENFNLTVFTKIWDLNNLREDDWTQRPSEDGFQTFSLVEKIISGLMRELNDSEELPDPALAPLIAQAIEQFPKNYHLQRYQAQLLIRNGEAHKAIPMLKRLLLKSPDKFYLWDNLADLIENDDVKMGLECGALTTGGDDKMLVKVRLKLAEMLCDRQMYDNALTELECYRNTFQRNNWPLRSNFYNVYNRIPEHTEPADNRSLYNELKAKAMEFIYSDLPTVMLVKTFEKKDTFNGKPTLNWQLRNDQQVYWLKPKKFRLDFRTPNGSAFKAKIDDKGQVVWIAPTELDEQIGWLRVATGPLQVKSPGNGKLFAFVDGVYMPGTMIGTMKDGTSARVVAIRNQDDRWTALSVSPN